MNENRIKQQGFSEPENSQEITGALSTPPPACMLRQRRLQPAVGVVWLQFQVPQCTPKATFRTAAPSCITLNQIRPKTNHKLDREKNRKRKKTNLAMAVEECRSTGIHHREDDRYKGEVNTSRFQWSKFVFLPKFYYSAPLATHNIQSESWSHMPRMLRQMPRMLRQMPTP
jgi:hypothetical protein